MAILRAGRDRLSHRQLARPAGLPASSLACRILSILLVSILVGDGCLGAPYRPREVKVGERYHLAFASFNGKNALSNNIEVYNTFVRRQAAQAADLTGTFVDNDGALLVGPDWNAIGSTFDVDARDNAKVEGRVFRMDGVKIADDLNDMWDGTLDAPLRINQFGSVGADSNLPDVGQLAAFTGSDTSGVGVEGAVLGSNEVKFGTPEFASDGWISLREMTRPRTEAARFYALSELLPPAPLEAGPLSLRLNRDEVTGTGSFANLGAALNPEATISFFQNPTNLSLIGVDSLPGSASAASFRGPADNGDGTLNGITVELSLEGFGALKLAPFSGIGGVVDYFTVDQTNGSDLDTYRVSVGVDPIAAGRLEVFGGTLTNTLFALEPDADRWNLGTSETTNTGNHTSVSGSLTVGQVTYIDQFGQDFRVPSSQNLLVNVAAAPHAVTPAPEEPRLANGQSPEPLMAGAGLVEISFSGTIDGQFGTATIVGRLVPISEPTALAIACFGSAVLFGVNRQRILRPRSVP